MPGEQILIVEDSLIVSSHLKAILSSEGYQISGVAKSAEEAIDFAQRKLPDLILMDIMLAGVQNGIDAAQAILEKTKVPLIFLTALTDKGTLEKAKKTGPVSYIIKPFDDIDLITRVEVALAKAKLERAHQLENMAALIEGQEKERGRVSRDLHDGLSQVLNGVLLKIESLEDTNFSQTKDELTAMVKQALDEVRQISDNLLPREILNFDIATCISSLCSRINSKRCEVIFQTQSIAMSISERDRLLIYRIVQESLQNALKHSGASRIFVQLYESNGKLLITIEDNGVGFSTSTVKKGLGLENIRYRTEMLNGTFQVESSSGSGTFINIVIPFEHQNGTN